MDQWPFSGHWVLQTPWLLLNAGYFALCKMTVALALPLIRAPLAENRSITSHPAFSLCYWSALPQGDG